MPRNIILVGGGHSHVQVLESLATRPLEDATITVVVDRAASRLPSVLATTGAAGVSVTAVDVTEPNLEAVFLHLTGKALRDEA